MTPFRSRTSSNLEDLKMNERAIAGCRDTWPAFDWSKPLQSKHKRELRKTTNHAVGQQELQELLGPSYHTPSIVCDLKECSSYVFFVYQCQQYLPMKTTKDLVRDSWNATPSSDMTNYMRWVMANLPAREQKVRYWCI